MCTLIAPWTNGMWAVCNVFSVQTSSNNVQEIIEGKVEKRTKGQSQLTSSLTLRKSFILLC